MTKGEFETRHRHGAQARRILIRGAFVAGIVGLLAATPVDGRAQSVRPLLGKLVVKVPRAMLQTDDYWIYVNSQIVSAPPHKPFAQSASGFVSVHASKFHPSDEIWNKEGQVAVSANGRMKYVKSGMGNTVFQSLEFQLSPGKYDVELMTRSDEREGFPFAVSASKIQIEVGKTGTVEFGLPASTNEGPVAPRAARAYTDPSKRKLMDLILQDLNANIKAYESDPVVAQLNKIFSNVVSTPPSRPKVYANMPDSMFGGRELDIRQLTLIIDRLEQNYSFDDQGQLKVAAEANPRLAEIIDQEMTAHNKRITNLREILKVLEQSKHS